MARILYGIWETMSLLDNQVPVPLIMYIATVYHTIINSLTQMCTEPSRRTRRRARGSPHCRPILTWRPCAWTETMMPRPAPRLQASSFLIPG